MWQAFERPDFSIAKPPCALLLDSSALSPRSGRDRGRISVALARLGNSYIANRNVDFRCVFRQAVGFQEHSPEQHSCYKFRDRWISGPPAPPGGPGPTFSGGVRASREPQQRRAFARKPQDRDSWADVRTPFSPPLFLQTSGLSGFSTDLVGP